jgi:hypothetical protein
MADVIAAWFEPEFITEINITVLTAGALLTAQLLREEVREAKRLIEAGVDARHALGPACNLIPLGMIEAIRVSNRDGTLSIASWERGTRAVHVVPYYANRPQQVYAALRATLGEGWQEAVTPETSWWRPAALPLLSTVFLTFLAFALHMATRQTESGFVQRSTRGRVGEFLFGWIGSTATLILTAAVFLGGLLWTIRAVLCCPPAFIVLSREVSEESPDYLRSSNSPSRHDCDGT